MMNHGYHPLRSPPCRNSLKAAGLLAAALLTPRAAHPTDVNPARPNIIVILCDDAGFADFGCFGGVSITPNIDRLASEGMRFTRAYSNARCMPTRLSILSGLPPQIAGRGLFSDFDTKGVTIAEVLGSAGYANYTTYARDSV
jgi:arylsulfatase A-like enzyme